MASSKEIAAAFGNLALAQRELRDVKSCLSDRQRDWLEKVPFRFLEWTLRRLENLERRFSEAVRTPCPETAALSARLFLEAVWTLRWIGSDPSRAREFVLAGFREQADINQTSIIQFAEKDADLKEDSIRQRKRLIEAVANSGLDLKTLERWPIASDLLRKKLGGITDREDKQDWNVVYDLSFLLHPTPFFVIADERVSTLEQVIASTDCAARIAQDIAAHLRDLYGKEAPSLSRL